MKDEMKMRAENAPWFDTHEQLNTYVDSLIEGPHDYGTAVEATALATEAMFNYMARKMGLSGFQASCADLSLIRRTRHIDGPFILLKGEDMLYPQYDLKGKLDEAIVSWTPWLKEQALKKLGEKDYSHVHGAVIDHWKKLAE